MRLFFFATVQLFTSNNWFADAVRCSHDGELLPNTADCRKYFKCSNGAPSVQSCPGSLIFDPVLNICNWPQSTTCVKEFTKPKEKTLSDEETKELLKGIKSDDSPTAPTAKPRRKNISSLFHTKDRKFTRISQRFKTRTRTTTRTTTRKPASPFRNRGQSGGLRDKGLRNRFSATREREEKEERKDTESRVSLFRNRGGQNDFEEKERRFPPQDSDINSSDRAKDDRAPFRNRGGGFSTSEEKYDDIRKELFDDDEEERITVVKPKAKMIKCHTGASNELYANPRNCRKYFKCDSGTPSLQSCPANLIFDTNLRICNWPDASECIEDPDAPLPEISSNDRAPPPQRKPVSVNAINIDTSSDYSEDDDFFIAPKPKANVAYPGQGSVPSEREAMLREEQLKAEYPLFEKVKKTVSTLDTKKVEEILPGNQDNPDNVKRVEFILSEDNYEDLFPRRHKSFTYRRLLQAIGKFPAICSYLGKEELSDSVCRRTLATMFAHFTQETGAHNPSDKEYEEWRQGLHLVRELGCTDTGAGCGYNSNCEDKDSITKKWACGTDRAGKFKKYYGRGAKQLSYNFNYGQFSQAMFGDGRLLLDYPDFVADTWLNMASATWFYATPQPPKPSMLHVIDGTWVPNSEDKRNGISPGFGATINIINGGLECNTKDGKESKQARNRIEYYKQFAWYLYVNTDEEELGCANQSQFTAGGSGALPIYWDKDWAFPYSCKLVSYQTAHSALVPGEYIDCVEENFKVTIRNKK